MKCYYCGSSLDHTDFCPECDTNVRIWKKVVSISNRLYNDGLAKAQVRDLSGAVDYLKMSLRYNKMNMNARNLLGLVYFEMGESVNAVSEWVISKSLIPDDNPAAGYLSDIQKSTARLDNLNQTIKKFNQALSYCQQGNYDLAVIQLKKVLALNPKMVKGHQLLALLYMNEDRHDLALRALKHAEKIDANNTNTMRYIKECREHLNSNGKQKKKEQDTVTYQSGNDIIIRPTKFTDNTAVLTVVNLLVGAAIGIAVVCFLVIPGIRQKANSEATSQLVSANETISTREQTIKGLEDKITDLNKQVEDANAATSSADEKTSSYENLLNAYVSYANEDFSKAAESVSGIKKELLSESAQQIYDQMMEDVSQEILKATYDEAMRLYEQKDYSGAIEKFNEVVATDESYEDGNAAYYLAFAYNYQEDNNNALKWFKIAVEHIGPSRRRTANDMIEDLESRGATVPADNASADGGQADNAQADGAQDTGGEDSTQ